MQEESAGTRKRDRRQKRRPPTQPACFGEAAAGNYSVMGRLMRISRLPVGDLGLLTVGFRITDRSGEKWTRRFNRFKYGEPNAAKAANHTFCAVFEDFLPTGNPRVVVSSVSSGQNTVQHDTPASTLAYALAQSRGWEWNPHHINREKIGIPDSPASPPRPSGTPPWTVRAWLPPSEASPAW